MPLNERLSLAEEIKRDIPSEHNGTAAAVEAVSEEAFPIDSDRLGTYLEPTSVRRARAFREFSDEPAAVPPVAPRSAQEAVDPVQAKKDELAKLSDDDLATIRDAAWQVEVEREAATADTDGLPAWEQYGSFTEGDAETGDGESELVEGDLFAYLNGGA